MSNPTKQVKPAKPVKPVFISDLRIPKGHSGLFHINHKIHPAGKPIILVNMKEAIMGGLEKPQNVVFDAPVKIHVLEQLSQHGEKNGVWMSDSPAETRMHKHVIDTCSGNILVAGLGLGYTPTELSKKSSVNSIDIVELNQDVINLVWRHVRNPKMNLITGDIFEWVATTDKKYDYLYFDILPDYNEDLLYTHVLPLFYHLRKNPIVNEENVLIWAINVIKGQLEFALKSSIAMFTAGDKFPALLMNPFRLLRKTPNKIKDFAFCRTKLPFYKWYIDNPSISNDELIRMMEFFVERFGLSDWAEVFDKYIDYEKLEKERVRIYA